MLQSPSIGDGLQRVEMHRHAKFRQNPSIRCGDIAIFHFFKMAAVRHLGFVWGKTGPPTKRTWWSLSICKIWLPSVQYFRKYDSLNFSRFRLENTYSRPKN